MFYFLTFICVSFICYITVILCLNMYDPNLTAACLGNQNMFGV